VTFALPLLAVADPGDLAATRSAVSRLNGITTPDTLQVPTMVNVGLPGTSTELGKDPKLAPVFPAPMFAVPPTMTPVAVFGAIVSVRVVTVKALITTLPVFLTGNEVSSRLS
jgi:hypothetical protein